ncbi:MAG TPA: AAA family ATPase [Candidatus Binatia bacterium]|nr:AAA family ATPase [Candidatus Binatia bacterium]
MHLQKLELVGFKSFAEKSELDFLPPSEATKGITAVVGPNGSGKSNVADAMRWVLGEQSLKLLRGKKAEDVIFSGSEKRARSGFAEATLYLNNEDGKIPVDFSEVAISRRIYRDGDSEYLINKNKVRLTDIQLLLAQSNFGARSYSVIGQGMVDGVLVATPQERKEFFDEAAGVKQFQLKRHQSVIKLDATRENLQQAEMLLAEIEPRMRSLARQVKRLEERGSLEEELHALKHQYYGTLWTDLKKQMDARAASLGALEKEWHEKESTLDGAKAELASLEQAETGIDGFSELQAEYEKLQEEKNRLKSQELQAKSKIEIAEQVKKRVASTMPLSKIIEEIGKLASRQEALIGKLRDAKTVEDAKAIVPELDALRKDTSSLRERLERPAPESSGPAEHDPALLKELAALADGIAAAETKIREAQGKLQAYNQGEQKKKEKFFSLQRSLQEKIGAAHALERRLGDERVEQARLDTRREALEVEMAAELGEKAQHVRESFTPPENGERPEAVLPQIQRLKYQLQLIGGIDTEVVKEYEETKTRFDFLDGQTTDLKKAIDDLDHVIAELDVTIKAKSESAFRQLNRDFDRYFKTLFGGGHAELIQLREEPKDEDEEGAEQEKEEKKEERKENRDHIVGIDITATPPGKKIKNIAMLSGGERALVSIALICAIMTSNPSPFVVLDEVDAALDESNADKFASIIEQLAEKTQFIVITHNRYTMRKANVLYGVTMRQDGTSMLLSINLDEAGNLKNEKRDRVTV